MSPSSPQPPQPPQPPPVGLPPAVAQGATDIPAPTSRQLAGLSAREQRNFARVDWVARNLGWFSQLWNRNFMMAMTWATCSRRLRVEGLEHVSGLGPQDRVILIANHRSFFDFAQVMAVTFRRTAMSRRLFFPVRSSFFYDHPLGLLVNLVTSGLTMFPPISRSRAGVRFNAYALDRLVAELSQPGTVVGIHPEGTRNKGPDPYTLLKTTRGVGRVALQAGADVPVIPVWVLGGQNNLVREIWRNFMEPGRYPLDVCFGAPVDLSDLADRGRDSAAWRVAAERCMAGILAQGVAHRQRHGGGSAS